MRAAWTVLAAAVLSQSAVQAAEPELSGLQRCVAATAARADLSGVVVVSRQGAPVAEVHRGTLAEPDSADIDEKTRFNLGSAGKMFTAVAIGQLIERGRLRLDQPIGDVVAGLTPEASRVSIRQLLDHTSGLGDFFAPENMAAMLRARHASDLLPLIAADKPAFPPGTAFRYSNSGFALLGIAIERASGLTYGAYLRRNVFGPAGMTASGLDPRPLQTLAVGMTHGGMWGPGDAKPGLLIRPGGGSASGGAAAAFSPAKVLAATGPGGRSVDPSSPSGEPGSLSPAPGAREGYGSPAGGVFSTAGDMNRFSAALTKGTLLSPSSLREFTSPQVEVSPASGGRPARLYGFGFGMIVDGGVRWIGHNGGAPGANVEVWFTPDGGWMVEVLSNRDPPVATDVMRRVRPIIGAASWKTCS